jgi:basic amino acid/polyamine antiporter, APA family
LSAPRKAEDVMGLWTRKAIETAHEGGGKLRRTLGPAQLVALGVGAIVGTGIYALIGEAAGVAGPGVMISFLVAGAVCAAVALCYGELASMMPASGSAYTYSYVAVGEIVAWVIGWALILEYSLVCSAVAVGWSGYAVDILAYFNIVLPTAVTAGPDAGGVINLPAMVILFAVAGLLCWGTRESALVNTFLVVLKLAALLLFIALAIPAFNTANFYPFMPNGFAATTSVNGPTVGVMAASALIFFAFYGFDAVSTAAEETKNPAKDLAIGIIGSMVICTALYVLVAAAAIGAMPPAQFAEHDAPLAYIIQTLGHPALAAVISGAAVLAMPTVILAFLFGQSRIFFVMARDGLLPRWLGSVNEKRGAPVLVTIVTAALVSVLAGLLPLSQIAALANAGTLAAFIAVAASLMAMRARDPDRPRPFKTPGAFILAPFAIIGCIYLFISLPPATQINFFIWMAIGLAVYAAIYFLRRPKASAPAE